MDPFSIVPVTRPVPPHASTTPRRRARALSRVLLTTAACVCATVAGLGVVSPVAASAAAVPFATAVSAPRSLLDSLRGRSRKLRVRFVSTSRPGSLSILRQMFGDSIGTRVGVQATRLPDPSSDGLFHFVTMRPFTDKVKGRIGAYRIGFFPSEQRAARDMPAANPDGFVEVTPANQDLQVSEHFRLRDFLTHDQGDVWPKYLVLREPLVDKLELVMDELRSMGIAVGGMRVMSGFRTPQYNIQGVGSGGRVKDSRHQYGDAADVFVVSGNGARMADLNRDGRVDTRDAKVLAVAAERVERAHPDLVGGVGIYPATSAHGPFVHIDVRGTKARWGAM